ncbi:6800_t:CDS:2, partial [Racocetra persica]
STSCARIPTQKKAPVWLFFELPFEKDSKQKAKYSLCAHDKYLIITCGSTTSMHNHITNIHHIDISKTSSSDDLISIESIGKVDCVRKSSLCNRRIKKLPEIRLIKVLGDVEVPSAST